MEQEPTWGYQAPPEPLAFAASAWPPLLWQWDQDLTPNFVHWDTSVAPTLHVRRSAHGHTFWVAQAGLRKAGVSWEWVELTAGVVAMVNPMAISTNLRLLSADGDELAPTQVLQFLHRQVYALPWQTQVHRALQGALEDSGE